MKEEDVRPEKLFKEYLALAEQDARNYFLHAPYYYCPCPACGNTKGHLLFRKMTFDYEECEKCHTLFVNPRPHSEAFNAYYTDSPSVRFWATHFYKVTEANRREQIIRPKAEMIKQYIDKYNPIMPEGSCILDIGAGYGVFCEELTKIMPNITMVGIEPAKALQNVCQEKGIRILPGFLEDIGQNDLKEFNIVAAVSFELMEHLHNPEQFIYHCSELLPAGSLLILTTLAWDGFDLQVLREQSNSIHPPHHINFLTKESITLLLQKHKFQICEIITPGKLDVDLVAKKIEHVKDPFIISIVSGDEKVKQKFQEFLQKAGLSSHMMVVAKRM